jgi:hypothetical protein
MDERNEKFLHSMARAMQGPPRGEPSEPPKLGGAAGEPVPAVDPEDLKAIRQIMKDVQAPTGAIGAEIFKQACKPGADIEAVTYRSMLIWFVNQAAPGQIERFTEDAICRAAAKVPAEWLGVGIVRSGLPFDMNEFLRLCADESPAVTWEKTPAHWSDSATPSKIALRR